jgi:hypothetical protein
MEQAELIVADTDARIGQPYVGAAWCMIQDGTSSYIHDLQKTKKGILIIIHTYNHLTITRHNDQNGITILRSNVCLVRDKIR